MTNITIAAGNPVKIGLIIILLLMTTGICHANNSYLQFDGLTGYVQVPSNSIFNLGTSIFSINFWMMLSDKVSTQYIFSRLYTSGNFINIYVEDSKLYCEISQGVEIWFYSAPLTSDMVGKWVFVDVGRSDSDIRILFDTVAPVVTEEFKTGNPNLDFVSGDVFLGCFNDMFGDKDYYFSGVLDNFRLYSQPSLSYANLVAMYANGTGTKYPDGILPAKFALNMDESTGTTTLNAIDGTLQGTLIGGVTWQLGGVPFGNKSRLRDRYTNNYRSRYL